MELLKASKDVFAWSHKDMLGIDLAVASHKLNVEPDIKSIKQKKRHFNENDTRRWEKKSRSS